jgi:hypothetical protein
MKQFFSLSHKRFHQTLMSSRESPSMIVYEIYSFLLVAWVTSPYLVSKKLGLVPVSGPRTSKYPGPIG